jgi:hypothetical protein
MSAKLKNIPARDLRIDSRVQRGLEEPHVARLVANWNKEFVGVLVGSQRRDGIYLTDGQQRRAAAMRINPSMKLPVYVHDDWTFQLEGESFLAFNKDSKSVHSVDKYQVAVQVGSTPEADIDRVIVTYGLKVGKAPNEQTLACPSSLLRCAKKPGWEPALHQTIQALQRAGFPSRNEHHWDAMLVEGTHMFLVKHGQSENFSMDTLNKAFQRKDFSSVAAIVQAARAKAVMNNRPSGEVARLITEAYNSKVRTPSKKLPIQ